MSPLRLSGGEVRGCATFVVASEVTSEAKGQKAGFALRTIIVPRQFG